MIGGSERWPARDVRRCRPASRPDGHTESRRVKARGLQFQELLYREAIILLDAVGRGAVWFGKQMNGTFNGAGKGGWEKAEGRRFEIGDWRSDSGKASNGCRKSTGGTPVQHEGARTRAGRPRHCADGTYSARLVGLGYQRERGRKNMRFCETNRIGFEAFFYGTIDAKGSCDRGAKKMNPVRLAKPNLFLGLGRVGMMSGTMKDRRSLRSDSGQAPTAATGEGSGAVGRPAPN
jgi:hypothetical protein